MLKTLRAIEIVESRFNFFTGVSKNDSTKLNVCSAGVAILSIPRIRNIAPLSLQRISNTQYPSR